MKNTLIALVSIVLSTSLFGQTNQNQRAQESSVIQLQVVELPVPQRAFRPRLTLQRALRLAERYVERYRIDISAYYLYEAKYVLYGSERTREPCWFFWWVNENGSLGDYIQIVVSINSGEIRQIPSM